MQSIDVAVIGAGASGFMAAITAAQISQKNVAIFEKSPQLLAKVRVSGGGRCNVTNAEQNLDVFTQNYPRGSQFVRSIFQKFGPKQTIDWFEARGLTLLAEADGRMFPKSNRSESVINVLLEQAQKLGVQVFTQKGLKAIEVLAVGYKLLFYDNETCICKNLIIATGGGPQLGSYSFLDTLALDIVPPVPSLFTFNVANSNITSLAGLSVATAKVSLPKHQLSTEGPLLITHWGLSGPAILKLSAVAAVLLQQQNYDFQITVQWHKVLTTKALEAELNLYAANNPKKTVFGNALFGLPQRLWQYLCVQAGVAETLKYAEFGKKKKARLLEYLQKMPFEIKGKSTFKEEFVTAGGVALYQINPNTMECFKYPNLFFCGEILDIDAVTGGYNFQSAWSTGWLAGSSVKG
jgi:predicted Rossmann fold flavoprotein